MYGRTVYKVLNGSVSINNTPEFRYVVGKNASMTIEKSKNSSVKEFENFIKEQFNLKY